MNLRRLITTLLLAFMAVGGTATAANADKPTAVIIEDTAGVLDQNTLLPAIKDIDFYKPTTVAVYTRAGDPSENLNEEVLAYAREEHPEWISEDGQKWADGLYLFALDPVGRQVGTYMGEDRKVSLSERTLIQESTYDLLRDAQWTEGTIQGIEAGAGLIERPWYRSFAFKFTLVLTGGIGCLVGWLTLATRRRNLKAARTAITSGDAAYASVTMDLDATELNANTLPQTSTYGAKMLAEHRSFMGRYETATLLGNEVRAMSDKDLRKTANRKRAEEYFTAASELDALDDAIADANTLLNLRPDWEEAWDRQTKPLVDDLAALDAALAGTLSMASGKALDAFRTETERGLREWLAGLSDGSLRPEDALNHLRDARKRLSSLLADHRETVIQTYALNAQEQALMRRKMEPVLTQRGRRGHGIIDNAYPGNVFVSVGSFNQAYNVGRSSVNRSRQAAATSSSRTGYGRSGGSFSGSGSSSRF